MIKKTITYTDYNDVERTEDFYFHLTKAEVMKMQMGTTGGLAEMIQRIVAAQDMPTIIATFEDMVLKAYGVKSPDGKQFIKNDEERAKFEQCPAFSIIFMELVMNDKAAAEFVNGVIPEGMKDRFKPVAVEG